MTLLDKVFKRDEREEKLKKEIRSLELRKESVFATIDGEILRLQRERSNVLFEAGSRAYDTWCKEKISADLSEYWDKMQQLEKLIDEQETKRIEMGNRYDEEICLISSSMGVGNMPINAGGSLGSCPKCNASIGGEDAFCQNCGTKLQ